jgi:hypothetical protein
VNGKKATILPDRRPTQQIVAKKENNSFAELRSSKIPSARLRLFKRLNLGWWYWGGASLGACDGWYNNLLYIEVFLPASTGWGQCRNKFCGQLACPCTCFALT